MRVLVIGGTGFIGPHVVRSLGKQGHQVTVFHRGRTEADLPEEVNHIHHRAGRLGDRSYFGAFAEEFRRLAPDVVLDMMAVTEADARATMGAFRGVARRVIGISSQDVYRAYGLLLGIETGPLEPVPITETGALRAKLFPYRADPPRDADDPRRWMDEYDKILVERVVLGDPELPGTVLRLPMVYGPQDKQHRLFEYLKRMDDRRPAIVLEQGLATWRWTRGYVENVAAAITLAVLDDRAAGQVYNVGETEALSTADWVERIGWAAEWTGRVVRVPPDMLPEESRNSAETRQDLVSDSSRIREELGYRELVPWDEAIARTVVWERAHPPGAGSAPGIDYATEDEILARLEQEGG